MDLEDGAREAAITRGAITRGAILMETNKRSVLLGFSQEGGGGGDASPPPSLVYGSHNCTPWNRRQKRFFHRAMSGLEIGGHVRVLHLTSSPESPLDIHRSFRAFVMRVRRRYGRFEYIGLKAMTKSGLLHLHLLYKGAFMPQVWISRTWKELHKAPIVHIESLRGAKKRLGGYLVKHLTGEDGRLNRFWWSWGWVYPGFVKDWNLICQRRGPSRLAYWKRWLAWKKESSVIHEKGLKGPKSKMNLEGFWADTDLGRKQGTVGSRAR